MQLKKIDFRKELHELIDILDDRSLLIALNQIEMLVREPTIAAGHLDPHLSSLLGVLYDIVYKSAGERDRDRLKAAWEKYSLLLNQELT